MASVSPGVVIMLLTERKKEEERRGGSTGIRKTGAFPRSPHGLLHMPHWPELYHMTISYEEVWEG